MSTPEAPKSAVPEVPTPGPNMPPGTEQRQERLAPGVHSFLDGMSPETLREHVMARLQQIEDPLEYEFNLRELGLSKNVSPEALKEAIETRIHLYGERVVFFKEYFLVLQEKLRAWLEEQGLKPGQSPSDVPVFITDSVLVTAYTGGFPSDGRAKFSPESNAVSLPASAEAHVLDHETFHAMSRKPGASLIGFMESKTMGNDWLNEGVTVMGELQTSPDRPLREDGETDAYIDGFCPLSRLFANEVGFSEKDLFRAYFQEEGWQKKLNDATQKRFGCSVIELDDLMIGYDEESLMTMKDIIQGRPAKLVTRKDEEWRLDKYKRLKGIFPLIELEIEM